MKQYIVGAGPLWCRAIESFTLKFFKSEREQPRKRDERDHFDHKSIVGVVPQRPVFAKHLCDGEITSLSEARFLLYRTAVLVLTAIVEQVACPYLLSTVEYSYVILHCSVVPTITLLIKI